MAWTRLTASTDVINCTPRLGPRAADGSLIEHKRYLAEHGGELAEIRNWR